MAFCAICTCASGAATPTPIPAVALTNKTPPTLTSPLICADVRTAYPPETFVARAADVA